MSGFVGRAAELATLREWVLTERCRLVAVLGMGGIGKTILVARLAHGVAPTFQRAYWRSLRDAPPISEWVAGAIGFLSDQRVVAPEGEGARLTVLLELLRGSPCLLCSTTSRQCSRPVSARVAIETALAATAHYSKLLARPDMRAAWC